jgi:hypothetical protein
MQLHSALLKPAKSDGGHEDQLWATSMSHIHNSFGQHPCTHGTHALGAHLGKHQVAAARVAQDYEPSARELRLVQHQNLIIARFPQKIALQERLDAAAVGNTHASRLANAF